MGTSLNSVQQKRNKMCGHKVLVQNLFCLPCFVLFIKQNTSEVNVPILVAQINGTPTLFIYFSSLFKKIIHFENFLQKSFVNKPEIKTASH